MQCVHVHAMTNRVGHGGTSFIDKDLQTHLATSMHTNINPLEIHPTRNVIHPRRETPPKSAVTYYKVDAMHAWRQGKSESLKYALIVSNL